MFTSTLAEVINVKGRTLSVQPLFNPNGVKLPPITGVQLGLFGNASNNLDVNIKNGDIVLILFTTFDISNFITFGNKNEMDTIRRNDLNSCIALPFTFNKVSDTLELPTSIRFTGNREENGNVSHTGDVDHNGNTNQTGDITNDGKIESTGDHKAGEISLIDHLTTGVTSGNDISGPPQ